MHSRLGLAAARVYDLGRPLEQEMPFHPSHVGFRMALLRRHGDFVRQDGSSNSNEMILLSGHTGTHIDALAHWSVQGRLHGGVDAAEASVGGRFQRLGVDAMKPIVCRGVLLDIPAAFGKKELPSDASISASDLELACAHHRVEVQPGDAVLVRTGWPVGRYPDTHAYMGVETGAPGLDTSGAEWLASKKIQVTGSDTLAYERVPPGIFPPRMDVHVVLLFQAGIPIIEVMDLEALAHDQVHEFIFIVAPLKIVGATGSPVRPLALVELEPK